MAVRHLNCSYMYSCSDVSKKIIVLLETLYQTIYSSLQQILRCQSSGHRLFQTRFGHGQQKSPLLNGACPLPGSSEQMWMFVPLAYSTIQQTSLNDVMLGKAELWYAKALVLDGRTYEERILKILVILGNLRGGHLNQSRNHTVFLEWALTHLLPPSFNETFLDRLQSSQGISRIITIPIWPTSVILRNQNHIRTLPSSLKL